MPYPVVACAIMFFWILSLRAYFFTVMPSVAADFSLSVGTAAALISAMSLGYCLAMWGVGFLPGSRKARVLLGVGASTLCTVAMALAPTVPLLFATAFAAGVGLGFYLPLGLAIITDASEPGRRARNMSLHEVAASAGNVAGPATVVLALPTLTWRQATIGWLLVGIVAFLAFALLRDAPAPKHEVANGRALRFDGTLAASVSALGINQLLIGGLIAVLPLILVNAWGVGQGEAAGLVGAARLAGLVGIGLAGAFGDRLGAARLCRHFFLLAVVCTAVMALASYGPLFALAVFGLNTAASGAIMLLTIVVAQVYPGPERERALGVTTGVAGLSSLVVAPAVLGSLIEQGLAQAPFAISAACALSAVRLVHYLGRRVVAVPERKASDLTA